MPGVRDMDFTFAMFERAMHRIYMDVKGDKPDIILGLARGGLIPAVRLSHLLGVPMEPLYWSLRDAERRDNIENIKEDLLTRVDYKVLVVDDIVDSGKLMSEVVEYLCDGNYPMLGKIQTASLVYNKSQQLHKPYFYFQEIDRNVDTEWINFWWEERYE